jgi:hypothetical protein
MEAAQAPRSRLSVDIPQQLKRRLRIAAAHYDLSLRQYVIDALEERLSRDIASEALEPEGTMSLTTQSDPVLAALWDNDQDAAYDAL